MKRYFCIVVLVVALMLITLTCSAAINFDISVFENNPMYTVEFDDMDDTGEIDLVEGGTFFGTTQEDDEGVVLGVLDMKIIEDLPPIIRLQIFYYGEDWVFTDKIIIKPDRLRYTFEVDGDTEVESGKIFESYVIALSDESIGFLKDIADGNIASVQYRLDGDRNVDGQLIFDAAIIKQFYEDYLNSGALNNDFSNIRVSFPCIIK